MSPKVPIKLRACVWHRWSHGKALLLICIKSKLHKMMFFQYNNQCWMMQQTCLNEKIVEVQSKGKCPHPSRGCQEHETCTCPQGIDGQNCDKCLPGFWAYTSFGCLDCGCTVMGSLKGKCDEFTGKCQCKSGFSGDKCEICPDGSKALLDGCPNSKFCVAKLTLNFQVNKCPHFRINKIQRAFGLWIQQL